MLGVMLVVGLLAGPAAADEAKKYKVAFLPTDMSMTFASWLADEMAKEFAKYPDLELTTIDSKNVLNDQIANMENCMITTISSFCPSTLRPRTPTWRVTSGRENPS